MTQLFQNLYVCSLMRWQQISEIFGTRKIHFIGLSSCTFRYIVMFKDAAFFFQVVIRVNNECTFDIKKDVYRARKSKMRYLNFHVSHEYREALEYPFELEYFYQSIVKLFKENNVGDVRIVAQKPST